VLGFEKESKSKSPKALLLTYLAGLDEAKLSNYAKGSADLLENYLLLFCLGYEWYPSLTSSNVLLSILS
jgi:hypothetical protein